MVFVVEGGNWPWLGLLGEIYLLYLYFNVFSKIPVFFTCRWGHDMLIQPIHTHTSSITCQVPLLPSIGSEEKPSLRRSISSSIKPLKIGIEPKAEKVQVPSPRTALDQSLTTWIGLWCFCVIVDITATFYNSSSSKHIYLCLIVTFCYSAFNYLCVCVCVARWTTIGKHL